MRLNIDTPAGVAWADVDLTGDGRMLVLGHGAGGSVDSPDLLAIRAAALAAGIAVARITQPYRVQGKRAPAAAPRLDAAWRAVVTALREGFHPHRLIVGGRSSGARVACRTAAATEADAVVALAFPLHPPGRPEKSRLDELELPTVPVLVVQGDRDAFGMPPAGRGRTIVIIDGADHSLKKNTAATARAVVAFVTAQSPSPSSDQDPR
jgi:predicted alpha/beta-hydrolase family hydrolase